MRGQRIQQRMETVYKLLQTQSTLVLSTTDAEGVAHATPLYFLATPAFDLYWLSSQSSRHSINLAQHPRASAAVFLPTFEWRQIAGVQMEGSCSVGTNEERARYLDAYCQRFNLGTIFSAVIVRSTMYRFRPRWLRYTDNRTRFGYRFEVTLPDV